jgi:hypothetical protein
MWSATAGFKNLMTPVAEREECSTEANPDMLSISTSVFVVRGRRVLKHYSPMPPSVLKSGPMDRKKTGTKPGPDQFATGPPVAVASVLDQAQLQLPGFGDILQPEKDQLRPVETSLYRLYGNQSEPDLWTQIVMSFGCAYCITCTQVS